MKMLICLLILVSGCASGLDGARQAETSVNTTIGAGYRGLKAYVLSADQDAVAKAKAGDDAGAQAEHDQTAKVASVGFQVLDDASVAADVQDKAIQVAAAAGAKDYGTIVVALEAIALKIIQTLATNGVKMGVN